MRRFIRLAVALAGIVMVILSGASSSSVAAQSDKATGLDERVTVFLKKMQYRWQDMNVPEADGKTLYEIIANSKYKAALEIGTSTRHSGIWMGWAMSKTGGKLITIEIDEDRYKQALANFKEAGVSAAIDARLADAHTLVNKLPGPFDFVFIDADKDWYTNYAKAVIPKLTAHGCIAAHNVRGGRSAGWRGGACGTGEYYDYMMGRTDFATSLVEGSPAGLALSCKKTAK